MNDYARWHDAMVMQKHALHFIESPTGVEAISRWEDMLNKQHDPQHRVPKGFIWRMTLENLRQADPIYVSSDVTEVIDYARESFRPEPVLAPDILIPCGFLLFPRAMYILDKAASTDPFDEGLINGELEWGRDPESVRVPVRAMSWIPIRPGEDMKQGGVWMTFWVHVEDDISPAGRYYLEQNSHALLTVVHSFVIRYGGDPKSYHREASDEEERQEEFERARQQWTLPQVTWRLMQQFVRSRQLAARPFRRDAQRKNLPETVTVIQLRRSSNKIYGEGEGGVLTKRHIVRGHWRDQWYPSLKEHRQIWIAPYVKGPEDGELVLTERAFEFVH